MGPGWAPPASKSGRMSVREWGAGPGSGERERGLHRRPSSPRRCTRDETYQPYHPPSPRFARFKFSSFHFLNRFPSVYLHCKVVVCGAHDPASRCRRGCVRRPKRNVGSYQEKVDVVLGPIQLQAPRA